MDTQCENSRGRFHYYKHITIQYSFFIYIFIHFITNYRTLGAIILKKIK